MILSNFHVANTLKTIIHHLILLYDLATTPLKDASYIYDPFVKRNFLAKIILRPGLGCKMHRKSFVKRAPVFLRNTHFDQCSENFEITRILKKLRSRDK